MTTPFKIHASVTPVTTHATTSGTESMIHTIRLRVHDSVRVKAVVYPKTWRNTTVKMVRFGLRPSLLPTRSLCVPLAPRWFRCCDDHQEFVDITHPSSAGARVSLWGATVTTYRNAVGTELLFVSKEAVFDAVKPIRGGIPLVFPQFGGGKWHLRRGHRLS